MQINILIAVSLQNETWHLLICNYLVDAVYEVSMAFESPIFICLVHSIKVKSVQ